MTDASIDKWNVTCSRCGHVLAIHGGNQDHDYLPTPGVDPCGVDGCFCHLLADGETLLDEPSVLYTTGDSGLPACDVDTSARA